DKLRRSTVEAVDGHRMQYGSEMRPASRGANNITRLDMTDPSLRQVTVQFRLHGIAISAQNRAANAA
ncbi:MAG: hypothetical protein MUP86_00125, partial [Dehalococcoidia bacterium]|nr:hypothetical protein [Dehalococcoidia bacterium]